MLGMYASTSMRNESVPAMRRGAYSTRKIAAPTATGAARTTAIAVVTRVPYRYAAAPKISLTGSQVELVRNPSPYVPIEGHAAATMRSVMPASVSGTMSASPVTPPANMRSPRPERIFSGLLGRKDQRAAARYRVDLGFGLRKHVGRKRRVPEALRKVLAGVRAPPG